MLVVLNTASADLIRFDDRTADGSAAGFCAAGAAGDNDRLPADLDFEPPANGTAVSGAATGSNAISMALSALLIFSMA